MIFNEIPANTRRSAQVVSMLHQRRRRWANIETTLAERLVFAGIWKCQILSVRFICRALILYFRCK